MDPGVEWLLASADPAIRYLARRDLLDGDGADPESVRGSEKVVSLLAGQEEDGGFGAHPYYGWWSGAHWRLLHLAELGFPGPDPAVSAAVDHWFAVVMPFFANTVETRNGLVRRHGCIEGNFLSAAARLGYAGDPRLGDLVGGLIDSQWPDGGWNADPRTQATTSSFFETHEPLAGLTDYHAATGDKRALDTAHAAADFFLRRRLFRSERTGDVIEPKWLVRNSFGQTVNIAPQEGAADWTLLHYPFYWKYDILRGLDILRPLGLLTDPRADEALDMLAAARSPDRTWSPSGTPHWGLRGEPGTADERDIRDRDGMPVEVINWGRTGPNEMITLIALRVLHAAGRLAA